MDVANQGNLGFSLKALKFKSQAMRIGAARRSLQDTGDGGTAGLAPALAHAAAAEGAGAPAILDTMGHQFSPAYYSWTYSFNCEGGSYNFTVETSTVESSGEYTDFSISGTADGQTITGLDSDFAGPDNEETLTLSNVDGIDGEGLSFDTASNEYNIYDYQNTLKLIQFNGPPGFPTDIQFSTDAPCYVRGTRIATVRGEVAVENLEAGDLLVTESGRLRPVRWIGHRRLDIGRHPVPASVRPVCVSRHAFGDNLPVRDLWLSPAHAIAAEGVLIPIGALVNGVTIVQHDAPEVEYWHVELDEHDVILAEGLPAESYLDTGNRAGFDNGGACLELHPDFRPLSTEHFCRPLCADGPAVDRVRATLLSRLPEIGLEPTSDAAPFIMADGQRIEPVTLAPQRLAFLLPAGCRDISLRSLAFVPAAFSPAGEDRRALGVCVTRLQLDGNDIALDAPALSAAGRHKPETNGAAGSAWRWTNGCAKLPANTRLVLLELVETGSYWQAAAPAAIAKAR